MSDVATFEDVSWSVDVQQDAVQMQSWNESDLSVTPPRKFTDDGESHLRFSVSGADHEYGDVFASITLSLTPEQAVALGEYLRHVGHDEPTVLYGSDDE